MINVMLSAAIVALSLCAYFQRLKRKEYQALNQDLQKELKIEIAQNKTIQLNLAQQKEMELLSIVATQTDNAIMIMDPKGNIEWINDGFTRMYEYTYEEFIQAKGSNILQTSFDPAIKERLNRCMTSKKPVNYEALNITLSGKEIWTETSLNPILNKNGDLIYLATIDSDISRRKGAGDDLVERITVLTNKINQLALRQTELTSLTDKLMDSVHESTTKAEQADLIVKVIREISDKIRLMGLNASIEAQAVGKLGEGFRVISGEIVKMSNETKDHAHEIYQIVEGIKSTSNKLEIGKIEISDVTNNYASLVNELRREVDLIEDVANRLN